MKLLRTLAVAVIFTGVCMAQNKPVPKPATPAVETKTPPAEWLQQYDDYMALARVIQQVRKESGLEKFEALEDEKGQTLRKGIPEGYTFDPATKTFTKLPTPPAAAKTPVK